MKESFFIKIQINNWSEYNTRKDIDHPKWFALSNKVIENPKMYHLSSLEFKAWIYLLSMASQQGHHRKEKIFISFKHAECVCGIPRQDILSCIEKMVEIEAVKIVDEDFLNESVRSRTDPSSIRTPTSSTCTQPALTLHNITLHNINTLCDEGSRKRDPSPPPPPDVEVTSEFEGDEEIKSFVTLHKISKRVQQAWIKLYPLDYVRREMIQAQIWLETNSARKPKSNAGYSSFMTGWLNRGWERHRKTIQSTQPVRSRIVEA